MFLSVRDTVSGSVTLGLQQRVTQRHLLLLKHRHLVLCLRMQLHMHTAMSGRRGEET